MHGPARGAVAAALCLLVAGCVPAPGRDGAGDAGEPGHAPLATAAGPADDAHAGAPTDRVAKDVPAVSAGRSADAFWAEEAEVRAAAIEYWDLYYAATPTDAVWPGAPDCAPWTWLREVAAGSLSYDEYTLRTTYVLFDEARLGAHAAELCEPEGTAWFEGVGFASMVFWDAATPEVKRETYAYWVPVDQAIEDQVTLGDAEDYRSWTAALRAQQGGS